MDYEDKTESIVNKNSSDFDYEMEGFMKNKV